MRDNGRGKSSSQMCLSQQQRNAEVPSWHPTGDLELEGRDMDGRVGTCPDGMPQVPSACPG